MLDTSYRKPSDSELITLFKSIKKIVVIGLSPKLNRPSYRVAKQMQKFGFDIIPVRPAVTRVLGEKAYPSLHEVPFNIDLVNVFRAPKYVADVVDQCINKKVKAIWLQEGVVDAVNASKAVSENIFTVMDKCIYKEYIRLMK